MRYSTLMMPIIASWFPAALSSQVVHGRVVDATTRQPISSAAVRLLDGETVVAASMSDSAGRFQLRVQHSGRFLISALRIGYVIAISPVELSSARSDTLELALQAEAVKLAPLTLTTPRDRYLESKGFYERLQSGTGDFMTSEQIRKRSAQSLADLLRSMRGVKI